MPDIPEPTAFFLTKHIDHIKVVKTVLKMFKKSMNLKKLKNLSFTTFLELGSKDHFNACKNV